MSAPALSVRDLAVRFPSGSGQVRAVDGVSFDLAPGERLAVVGESGSGKSVMSMALMGLVAHPGRIERGRVELAGRGDLIAMSERQLNRIRGNDVAMVFQDPMSSLNPVLRIDQQLLDPIRRHLALKGAEARARALDLLTQVGIPDPDGRLRAYPHELSGGMRQRVMIALALSCHPTVLLADEPTTALDVTIQAQIVRLLSDLCQRLGTAVLFVTHDLGLVARFADTVAVMYAGRVVERGPAGRIFTDPQHPYTQALLRAIPSVGGDRDAPLAQIPGAPPSLAALPQGCAFAPRCAHAVAACATAPPPLTERGGEQRAACIVTDPNRVRGESVAAG